MTALERWLVRMAWRLLVRRGWVVQVNTPDVCSNVVQRDDGTYDVGWRPFFSVRYGHTPVFRGPGNRRVPRLLSHPPGTLEPSPKEAR